MITLADHLPPDDVLLPALSRVSGEMKGSMILKIAGEVRALVATGRPVANLTVGDFDPVQFPIPASLTSGVAAAYTAGQTNYPPPEGLLELRQAICRWYERQLGLKITPDWIVVAGGARPVMYATYRLFLEIGEEQLFSVPSWNSAYYGQLCDAKPVALYSRPEDDFFPDPAKLAEKLRTARTFTLNTPLNPTGTAIHSDRLREIAQVVVDENKRRLAAGRRPVMWMFDQVYWQLCFGEVRHHHPCTLVPEVTPWVVTVDAISKSFAATGLRVGWAVLPPVFAAKMKALVGHMGAWAPRPEQSSTAQLLSDPAALEAYDAVFRAGVYDRLTALHQGLTRLGVEHIVPQGALYLSVRFDLFGRPGVDGQPMRTNEDVRRWVLEKAGIAVVPFQAFDLPEDTGWFRCSVGAVSVAELEASIDRLGAALAGA